LCSTKNPATQPMAGEVRAVAAKAGGAVRVVFHRTDGDRTGDTLRAETNHLHVSTESGRVDVKALREALREVRGGGDGESAKPPLAFLCGPPAMSDAAEAALLELGMPKEDVRLERWW
jgi:ferredoxin-NADP reductase